MTDTQIIKIVDEMSVKHGMCFTELERTLLESAILRGALFMANKDSEILKKIRNMNNDR